MNTTPDLDALLAIDEPTRAELEREAGIDRLEELGAALVRSVERLARDLDEFDRDD